MAVLLPLSLLVSCLFSLMMFNHERPLVSGSASSSSSGAFFASHADPQIGLAASKAAPVVTAVVDFLSRFILVVSAGRWCFVSLI